MLLLVALAIHLQAASSRQLLLLLVALAINLQAASCRALAVQNPSCTPVARICNGALQSCL